MTTTQGGVVQEQARANVSTQARLGRYAIEYGIWGIVILACIAAAVLNPHTFLSSTNLTNILQQSSVIGVLVVAESLVLLGGNFDLSIQSTLGFCAMIAAWLMTSGTDPGSGMGMSPLLAIPIILIVGGCIGAVNSLLVVRLRVNAFIATLGMLILLQGLTLALTSGQSIFGLPHGFTFIGSDSIAGFPVSAAVMLVAFLIAWLVLRYRTFGRHLYAVGGNERVAFAAGIRSARVITVSFVTAGVLAAIAGWVLAGQLQASVAGMGSNVIFDVFAAAVIGGIGLNGGRGNMLNALGGVLLFGVISNMLTLAQVDPFWVDAVRGGLILIAVLLDAGRSRLEGRS